MNEWITSLGSVWKACCVNAIFLLSAYSLGNLLISLLKIHDRKNIVLSLIIGINIYACLAFLLATAGIFRFIAPIWIILLCVIPILIKAYRQQKEKIMPGFSGIKIEFVILIVLSMLVLAASLSMPIGWDEMVYHQAIVQRWINDGIPAFYADLPYSAFPSANAFIFWMLADSGTVIAPRLFIWACWILSLLALYQILNTHNLRGFQALALTAAFALSRTVLVVVSDAYVETLLLLNTAGMLILVSNALQNKSPSSENCFGNAILFGIMAGGAGAIKLTGMILFAIPLLWFAFALKINPAKRTEIIRSAALFILVGMIITIPFYLRPLLSTGNPFYPYFCQFFSDSPGQLEMSEFHHQIGSAKFGDKSLPMFFAAPFALAFSKKTFDGAFGWQLLLLVALAIIATITVRKNIKIKIFGTITLSLYISWFFSAQQARFLVPGVFMLYLYVGTFLAKLKSFSRILICGIIFLLAGISIPWENSGYYYFSWAQLFGKIRKIDFLHTGTGGRFLPAVDAVINLTPKDARLMLLFEHRILYFPRKTTIATPYFQEQFFTPVEAFSRIEELENEFLKSKSDYLLVAISSESPDEIPEYQKKHQQFITALRQLVYAKKLQEIWRSENYSLFKINITPHNTVKTN